MTPANKGRRLPPEPLTPDEVRSLINACSPRAPTGIRNRALLVVLYRGGLRISEALSLAPKDLDRDAGTIRVLRGKGKTHRLIGLDPGAWAILQLWLERRTQLDLPRRAPVFCTLAGEPIKTAYVRALLPRLARRAGLQKRCHPHGLRHTFALELANESVPVHLIQQQLGHSSLTTTDRYIKHLHPVAVVDAMKSRAWRL